MTLDKRNIDILFKEGLKGLREKPPVSAWDRLSSDLNRGNSKKTLVYFRWIAASLLILLAFGSGYFYAKYKIVNSDEIVKSDIIQDTSLINDPFSYEENIETKTQEPIEPVNQQPVTLPENEDLFDQEELLLVENDGQVNNLEKSFGFEKNENVLVETSLKETEDTDIEIASNETIKSFGPQDDDRSIELKNQITEVPIFKREISKIEKKPVYSLYYDDFNDYPKKDQLFAWSIGARLAPIISYRNISTSNSAGYSQGNDIESGYNNSEEPLLAFSGGIEVNYNLSKRWSIHSGLYISRVGQVNNNALDFKVDKNQYVLYSIGTSTGNIDVVFESIPEDVRSKPITKDTIALSDNMNVKIVQNFDFFEIPLLINYRIIDRKLAISFSGGLSPAYLIKNNTILEVENDKYDIGSSSNLNSMIYNSTFGLGLEYSLSKKLIVNLEPTFKYSLNSLNKDSQLNYHPYSLSWFTGIKYKF